MDFNSDLAEPGGSTIPNLIDPIMDSSKQQSTYTSTATLLPKAITYYCDMWSYFAHTTSMIFYGNVSFGNVMDNTIKVKFNNCFVLGFACCCVCFVLVFLFLLLLLNFCVLGD